MPRAVTIDLFKFDELSDAAKEKARDWYRDGGFDYEWWDSTYEDAACVAEILGIEITPRNQRCILSACDGSAKKEWTDHSPSIFFSGFSSQGDGACFEGYYKFAADASAKIREYASQDTELHRIADELTALQAKHENLLQARVKQSGHYYHEYCTEIDVVELPEGEHFDNIDRVDASVHDELVTLLRDFMRWIYKQLESTWDDINSDD